MTRGRKMRTISTTVILAVGLAALPTPGASAIPATPLPFFMAGGQCDTGSPYVRYRVTNKDSEKHQLVIKVDGDRVVGPVTVKRGETVKGKFVYDLPPNKSRSVVARWKDEDSSHRAKLRFRTDNCEQGAARGPWFIAGQHCGASGENRVRFSVKNNKSTAQPVDIRLTNHSNQNEVQLWPNNDDFRMMEPGEKVTKSRDIPLQYGPGDEVRVRAYWVVGDPGAHNRAVFRLFDCGA